MTFRPTSEIARTVLWRRNFEEIRATRDLKVWRSIRKEASKHKVNRPYIAVLDALRPTRREGRALRELARLAAKREAEAKRPLPKPQRPLCGARTRSGGSCRAKVCPRPDGQGMATKCRLHGGASTGATEPGRAAIARSNATRKAPTKYGADVCAKLLAGIAGGSSVARSCRSAGVSVQTFYNWQNRYPEFAAAVAAAWPENEDDVYAVLGIPRDLAKKLERMEGSRGK